MAAMVDDFLIRALHTFQIRTLRSLGFNTRVSLTNKSQEKVGYATNYRVDLTVYGPDRQVETSAIDIATLNIGETVSIDCEQWTRDDGLDRIMIFHLIPERFAAETALNAVTSISREEIWSLFTAQDHHVEYYRDDGFSSGVLYQSGAFNYPKFSQERSTLIQAPKVCISSEITTFLSLMHISFAPAYKHTAEMKFVLMDAKARVAASGVLQIREFETLLVDFSDILKQAGHAPNSPEIMFYTLYAICDNASLLPLILNQDIASSSLSVEHSLPPMYYGQALFGAARAQTIQELISQPIFQEIP